MLQRNLWAKKPVVWILELWDRVPAFEARPASLEREHVKKKGQRLFKSDALVAVQTRHG